jgi:hypothetical protein
MLPEPENVPASLEVGGQEPTVLPSAQEVVAVAGNNGPSQTQSLLAEAAEAVTLPPPGPSTDTESTPAPAAWPIVPGYRSPFPVRGDAAQTIADFDRLGIELVAIAEGFDMTNPYGRAMAQMASVFAELERAMIRERTRAAMKVKRDRRERISRHAPVGWDFGPSGTLAENRARAGSRGADQEPSGAGVSLRKIAGHLNERGYKPKRGKRWLHSTVIRVLSRPA